jgi:hypothetical protein
MASLRRLTAASLVLWASFSVGCSRVPTGLVVRIAGIGECPSRRDIVLHVTPGGGLKLNSEDQNRQQLGQRLKAIFAERPEKFVFITADPAASFGEVVAVIETAAKQADYVALVTPSIAKQSTNRDAGGPARDNGKDACLTPGIPNEPSATPLR